MKEKFLMWLAWKLPRPLVYMCAVRVGSEASIKLSVREMSTITVTESLKLW